MVTNILKKVIQNVVLIILVVDNLVNIKTLCKKKHRAHHHNQVSLTKIIDFYKNNSEFNNETAFRMMDSQEEMKSIAFRAADSQEDNIKTMLEKKYRFRNDKSSTRFRIAHEHSDKSVIPESEKDRHIAWVFRSYAVRRIVGGMDTSISMYPYNVAISRNSRHWCGGSIIDEQWVLTAGHCLESVFDGDKKKLRAFTIRAGSSFHNKGGYQARVNKVFFPPEYVPGNVDFDYSLLRLDRPMPIGRNIAVLNLPSRKYIPRVGDILIVTGWGSVDESGYGHIPDRLHFVPVPVMKQTVCQKSYQFHITSRMMCAGYDAGGKDACNHDSGGPAVRDGILLGVVSFGGKKCGDPNSPGVYARVSEITNFVEETVTNNEVYTVPELLPKLQKAKQRKEELQRFKAKVEDKKNKIRNWFRNTINSPVFIKLAKKKLKIDDFLTRRNLEERLYDASSLDDKTLDDINLINMIKDSILEDGDGTEEDKLLRTLAVHEVILNEESEEKSVLRMKEDSRSIDSVITFIVT